MSGFAALYNNGLAGLRAVHAMLDALGAGAGERLVCGNGPVALAQAARGGAFGSTMAPLAGGVVVVGDIRIDNRDELFALLGANTSQRDISDHELLAIAFERWGDAFVERVHGDFAFALYDPRSARLVCVRDRCGVRPLYYRQTPEGLAAASSIAALLALDTSAPAIDELWVGEYLVGLFGDQTRTMYSGVARLAPAHMLTCDGERIELRRYAALDAHRRVSLGSDGEYAEAFLEHLSDAVRARLRTQTRRGAALSGGLDSSTVAALAGEQINAGSAPGASLLATFSAVFEGIPEADERAYIEAFLAGGAWAGRPMQPAFVRADLLAPLGPGLAAAMDEPFFSPNLFVHDALFAAAKAAGVGVWLDGLDGDTTVSHGTGYLMELALRGRWGGLKREASALAGRLGHGSWTRTVRRAVLDPLLRAPLERGVARLAGRAPWAGVPLAADFTSRIGLRERFAEYGVAAAPRTERADHLRRLTSGVHAVALETLHHCAARHGIEPRYPFYDWRLIEFCLALPSDQKFRDGWGRWIMRNAMSGRLPDEIAWRTTKGNPGANFVRSFRRDHAALLATMAAEPGGLDAWADLPRLREMVGTYLAGSDRDVLTLWRMLTVWLWSEGDRTLD